MEADEIKEVIQQTLKEYSGPVMPPPEQQERQAIEGLCSEVIQAAARSNWYAATDEGFEKFRALRKSFIDMARAHLS